MANFGVLFFYVQLPVTFTGPSRRFTFIYYYHSRLMHPFYPLFALRGRNCPLGGRVKVRIWDLLPQCISSVGGRVRQLVFRTTPHCGMDS